MKNFLVCILIMISAKSHSANIESYECHLKNDISIFIKLSEEKCEVSIQKSITLDIIWGMGFLYKIDKANDSILILSDSCRKWILLRNADGTCKVTKGPDFLMGRVFNRYDNNSPFIVETIKKIDHSILEMAPIMLAPITEKIAEGNYKLFPEFGLELKITSNEYCIFLDDLALISGRYEQKGQCVVFYNEDEKQEFFAIINSGYVTFKMAPGCDGEDITIEMP
ncbi:MAG: hypothetical protein J6X32_00295 [Salinivirgaceae bacterium]|nr:hypothetical protein [Salinivirgaceae bacterium]